MTINTNPDAGVSKKETVLRIMYDGFVKYEKKIKKFQTVPDIAFLREWEEYKDLVTDQYVRRQQTKQVRNGTVAKV